MVKADSSDAVTIRIVPSGVTYSSDIKRLRKVRPEDGEVKKSDVDAGDKGLITTALDVAALERALSAKFSNIASGARHNPHAAPGTQLHSRFVKAAAEAAPHKVVDVMVHGTAEDNIDSIMQTSLRGRAGCGTCWFTDDIQVASGHGYAMGAQRIIGFAVLRDKGHTHPIYTTKDPAHHLPLFEMRMQ